MNPFSRSNFTKDKQPEPSARPSENLSSKDSFVVLRFGEIHCTIKGISKIPNLLQDSNINNRQDALWILRKTLEDIEARAPNLALHDLDIPSVTDLLFGRLCEVDIETSFLSMKAITDLFKWEGALEEDKMVALGEYLTTFLDNMEFFQFQCLDSALSLFQFLQSKINEDKQFSFGETFSRRLLEFGESLRRPTNQNSKARINFLSLIKDNFHFIENQELFSDRRLIKMLCEYMTSKSQNERSLALQIIFKLSKNKLHSKLLIERISLKHVYKGLTSDDQTAEILINILHNLCQHRRILQEQIADYPEILRSLVQYFEKLLGKIEEDKDTIITLTRLIAELVEYGPIRAQISQYGIYSVLSNTRKAYRNTEIKEEIFKMIDRLANTYQDYELVFQRGIIDFISQDIAYQNEELIGSFIDFMIKATNSKYLSKDNLGVENAMNLEDIVKKTRNIKLRHKIDDLNLLLDREGTTKTQIEPVEIKAQSEYEVNSEKVKYQQILNFKIEGLVTHLAKKHNTRKTESLVEKMISNLDIQLQNVNLNPDLYLQGPREPGNDLSDLDSFQFPKQRPPEKIQQSLSPPRRAHITQSSNYQGGQEPTKPGPLRGSPQERGYPPEELPPSYGPGPEKIMNRPRFDENLPVREPPIHVQNNPPDRMKRSYNADNLENPFPNPERRSSSGFSRKLQTLPGTNPQPTRPVPTQDYSIYPGDNRAIKLPPRNPSRERKSSASRNLFPAARRGPQSTTPENMNNYSSIEPYRSDNYDSSPYDQNLNQSFDRAYPEDRTYVEDFPMYERRDNVRLPAINPNPTYVNKSHDYQSTIEAGRNRQDKKAAALPKIESFPFSEVEGIDQLIAEKYLNVDFTNVKLRSSKMLRHYMKLGIPEARGLVNITGTNTVENLILWFSRQIMQQDVFEVIEHLQAAIGSSSRTAFLICILVSLGERQGISFENFRNDSRVYIE